MNTKNKKLFLIFPKESESEQDLFKTFYSTISESLEKDNLIKFLLKNSEVALDYQDQFYDSDVDNADQEQAKKELIKKEKDLVIECFIKLNNTEFFSKIKNSYQSDTKGICSGLWEILSSLKPVLKKFKIDEELSDFSKIIVAAHLGGQSKIIYLDIQHTINEYLPKSANSEDVKFVYFSGLDEPAYNKYIHDHVKFSAYSYEKLIKEKSDEQFKYFLELLEARAEGEEIKYFESVVTKKYINDLIKIFLPTAIDCNGIHQLSIRNQDTTQYSKEAFDKLSLKDYLNLIWINNCGESTLSNLSSLSPGKANKLKPRIHALRNADREEDFAGKFKEFTDDAASVKESLYNMT